MILGLTGYAGAGKDTVAEILVSDYGFRRVAYADKLKTLLEKINPDINGTGLTNLVAEQGWDAIKQNDEVRALLQRTGQGARETLGDSVWINALYMSLMEINYDPDMRVVLTDIRYPNETSPCEKLWRVVRDGVGPVNAHPSETNVDGIPVDYVIDNSGTLAELPAKIREAMTVGGNDSV